MEYSKSKLLKAQSMTFEVKGNYFYVKAQSDKDSYKYKISLDSKQHPICNCWWYRNRTMNHHETYGMCSHQLGFLHKYNHKKYIEEITNE